jgi:hypothetical protein
VSGHHANKIANSGAKSMLNGKIIHVCIAVAIEDWAVGFAIAAMLVAGWIGISWGVGRLSGWARLAHSYRARWPAEGVRIRFQSMRLGRLWGYNQAITWTCGREGLHISTMLVLRVGHPPLFVPWDEVCVCVDTWRFLFLRGRCVRMRFSACPDVEIVMGQRAGRRLMEAMPEGVDGCAESLKALL